MVSAAEDMTQDEALTRQVVSTNSLRAARH